MKKLIAALAFALFAPHAFATAAYVNYAENSGNNASTLATSSPIALTAGNVVEIQLLLLSGTAGGITLSDGLGNTPVLQTYAGGACNNSPIQMYTYVETVTTGGSSVTFTASSASNVIQGIYVKQITGVSTTVIGSNCFFQGGPGSGLNVIVSGNVSAGANSTIFVSGFTTYQGSGPTPQQTAGTSPLAFTGRTAVWSMVAGGSGTAAVPEDLRVTTASGNYQATFGVNGGGGQFQNMYTTVVLYAEGAAGPPASFNMFLGQ